MENEQQQSRVTLKAVKYSASLSQETAAFTADVIFDGKRIAHAHNNGCGGMTLVSPYDGKGSDVAEAERYVAQFQNICGKHDFGMHTLDSMVDSLLDDYLIRRDLTKLLKSKTAGVVGADIRAMRAPYSPATVAAFHKLHPGALILNAIPFEDALKVYKAENADRIAAAAQVAGGSVGGGA